MQRYLNLAAAGRRFRRGAWLVAVEQDEQATLGPRMFDRDPQQRLDELAEFDLPRDRLRGLEHRSNIQPLDGRAEGCGGRRRFPLQPGVTLVELPHFAERAPPKIAVPRVSQIGVGDGLEAARRVEACGQLMGKAFVLDEAVLARRVDGLFIEVLRVQFPLFQTRELGANQCRPVCERCRTVVCPDRYLIEMRY